ncbi:MAG: hypothetical protein O9340_14060 [Cyclobacteriaceae bacterium]|nr:hypothetical protein [Cyclobacteriaceae bacterium]
MKFIFSILFFFLVTSLLAQENFFTGEDPFGFHRMRETFFNSEDPFNFSRKKRKLNQDTIVFKQPIIAVNLGVLPLMGYFSTLQFGFEHKVSKKINLHYEWGKVIHAENGENFRKRSGYRLRFEPRYYFRNNEDQAIYASAELFYNNLRDTRSEIFGVNCPNGQCDYIQYARFTDYYEDYGMLIKFGSLYEIRYVKGMFLDFNVGFGFRDRTTYSKNRPQGGTIIVYDYSEGFEPNFQDYSGFHMNVSFRIGYRFK